MAEGTSIADRSDQTVSGLSGNCPNLFGGRTAVGYQLPRSEHNRVVIFDALGREVRLLYSGIHTAGKHELSLKARNLASGLRFCQREIRGTVLVSAML